jgi:uncharacterized protein (TIGR03032 family)
VHSVYCSSGLASWLSENNGFLAVSTYESAKVYFVLSPDGRETRTFDRFFGPAMGLAFKDHAMWVGSREQLWKFVDTGPQDYQGTQYDAFYIPRSGHFIGACDSHDLALDAGYNGQRYNVVFANTRHNCISALDDFYAFKPIWHPPFIDAVVPEDRCHLNGFCLVNGDLGYATVCATTNTRQGWRDHINGGGAVFDIKSNEIVCSGLSMPHSPRWHDNRLWLLDSANGNFGFIDLSRGKFIPVAFLPGFARGMIFYGHYAIIALSRMRPSSLTVGMLLEERLKAEAITPVCGLVIFNLRTGEVEHTLTFDQAVNELYDVAFVAGSRLPYSTGFHEPEVHKIVSHVAG